MVQPGDRVVVVICLEEDGELVFHVFSSDEVAGAFCHRDPRTHIVSDRLVDMPERHEGVMN